MYRLWYYTLSVLFIASITRYVTVPGLEEYTKEQVIDRYEPI